MVWLFLYSLLHRIHLFFFFTIWIQTHNLQVRKQVISIMPTFWCLKNNFMVKYTDTTLILLPSHTGLMLIFKWALKYILIKQKFQVGQIILGKKKKKVSMPEVCSFYNFYVVTEPMYNRHVQIKLEIDWHVATCSRKQSIIGFRSRMEIKSLIS